MVLVRGDATVLRRCLHVCEVHGHKSEEGEEEAACEEIRYFAIHAILPGIYNDIRGLIGSLLGKIRTYFNNKNH